MMPEFDRQWKAMGLTDEDRERKIIKTMIEKLEDSLRLRREQE